MPGRAPVAEIRAADLQALSLTSDTWMAVREVVAARMDEATAALANLGA
jgi:hypothetical protein